MGEIISKTIIFKGTIVGKVKRTPIGVLDLGDIFYITSFIIQLTEQIKGVPSEIPVYLKDDNYKLILTVNMSEGDIVHVNGKIYNEPIKFWNKNVVWMRAEHIYNENLNFGY